MVFEWDETKYQTNIQKHGFPFEVAVYVLGNPHLIMSSNKQGEARWIAVGPFDNRLVTVVFTKRNDNIRVISIRRSRREEETLYRSIYP